MPAQVETVLVPNSWKKDEIIAWMTTAGYRMNQEEFGLNLYHKYRQLPRELFSSFSTRRLENGVMLILGYRRYTHPTALYNYVHTNGDASPDSSESAKSCPGIVTDGYSHGYHDLGINDYLSRE